ncbi:flagellar export protein FliJ [Pokkaliibacter sp. MBI-7]|uniref:Flagellar FliJ protein n=1 Tax=Proteobacteria bacterium 228 TaxID=2083153 RepID=A0A2S5KUI8_9PROT|nr:MULTISPECIES: flagellar export protein FliJ [Pokkaliibacter]MDH2431263.1 flagellar export protein FliJ [Pokkaliibacter sp. MBI-7]PPC78408.1 flagellar export protein FliJ [Pokkaliibacter plantistimulans]
MALRSQRLHIVLTLAQRDEQKAAQRLATQRQRLSQTEGQLQQLQGYQLEYIEQLHRKGEAGVSARDWLNQQQFMARLETALGQQGRAVAQQQAEVERHISNWQQARARVKAIEAWLETIKAQEQLELGRKEQKALDELIQHYRSRGDID